MQQQSRCAWCLKDPLYRQYHDQEWGVPVLDDQVMFEFLLLEGAQAGLAWLTVLRKREGYRNAFDRFDAAKIARYSDSRLDRLLNDPAIIRNRLKIHAARNNARAFLDVQEQFGSFAKYLWQFVDGVPVQNNWRSLGELPVTTPQSDTMSKDLKQKGFQFVGSTICYAHMQATGMVNDHVVDCFRHRECRALGGDDFYYTPGELC